MIFDNLLTENKDAFVSKVNDIATFIGIKPEWLMFVMWFESRLNSHVQNKTSGATGLIQFMPSTAHSLGTTTDALAAMTSIQQLDYVQKYFTPYKGKIKAFTDTYLVVFFPAAIGQPDSYVIETKNLHASLIAKQNPIFDVNKDGIITKSEIKQRLIGMVPDGFKALFT